MAYMISSVTARRITFEPAQAVEREKSSGSP